MGTYTPSPGPFKPKDADPEATLERFVDYVEQMELVFMIARKLHPVTGAKMEFDSAEKKAMLKIEGGADMVQLLKKYKVEEVDTYQQAVEKVKNALKTRGNRTAAVFKLFNGHKQGSQSFDSWHQSLVKAANLIDWTGYDASRAAADAILLQTSSLKLQQRALQENPDLDQLIALGMSQEQARKKASSLPGGQEEDVNRLRQENETVNRLRQEVEKLRQENRRSGAPRGGPPGRNKANEGAKAKCAKCCTDRCPDPNGLRCMAAGKRCLGCGEASHFARSKLCQKKKKVTAGRIKEAEASFSESEDSDRVGHITMVGKVSHSKNTSIYTKVLVSSDDDETFKFGASMKMAMDTGVRKTILNKKDWEKIQDNCLLGKTKIKFRPYGTDVHLPVRGRAKVRLRAEAGAIITTFVYINDDANESSLLGKRDAQRLGIVKIDLRGEKAEVKLQGEAEADPCRRLRQIKRNELAEERTKVNQDKVDDVMNKIVNEHKDVFGGIGQYKGDPVQIQMAEDIKPVIQAPRRIPLHYMEPLKQHLEEMVLNDVIEGPLKEEEKGSWISNLVITDKKWDEGKPGERQQIRANLDLRPLNKHVYQTHEPIPTPEELKHKLKGSDRFSALDMVHSFHQFVLEDKARKLFTCRTPWGLYRYKRLVMGNSPASSECHRRVRAVLAGLDGVAQIKDDVLVYGKGKQHDERLKATLGRFLEAGLTLRREKCHLGQQEVKWFGNIFSQEGMSPDPDKVKLIKGWPRPTTVSEVKSFLQTVQFNAVYLAAQSPGEMNYPELTEPLRALTRAGRKFTWTKENQKHFHIIKERLAGDHVMVPWDPARETRVYTDGGSEGCQATVAQLHQHPTAGEQWRPVAHTARAWTEPEKRYSQIEKESNALQSGIKANKMYLLGKPFQAMVDHRPLLPLYNSPGRPKQMRVDRHRMKVAAYDFIVEFIPGTKTPCDYGSRRGCPPAREYSEEEAEELGVEHNDEIYVNRVVDDNLPFAITRDVLRDATAKDTKLQQLMQDIQAGAGSCRKALTGFTHVFEELAVVDGVVVRGAHQLVIPAELQALVVQIAHEAHLGADKTLGLLRETCWWPGMYAMVREYVETCVPCQAAMPHTNQEPMKATQPPDSPWQHVHMDFKGPIGGHYYIHTIIDELSKYPVVEVCKSTSWESMRPMLDRALGMFGNVESITSDNGPPYSSTEFNKYVRKRGIRHRLCTPENPQANGQVEVFQKVIAKMVHTAIIEREDPKKVVDRYLQSYRAAPHKTTGKSPYEIMFGRKMKTNLPGVMAKSKSKLQEEVKDKFLKEKEKQKKYSDKKNKAKEKVVKPGDKILVKREKTTTKSPWDPSPYSVVKVQGSKVTATRGEQTRARAKNHIKVVKERPGHLQVQQPKRKKKPEEEEELDLEVDMTIIRQQVLTRAAAAAQQEAADAAGPAAAPPPPPPPPAGNQDGGGPRGRDMLPDPPADPAAPGFEAIRDAQLRSSSVSRAGRTRKAPDRLGVAPGPRAQDQEQERSGEAGRQQELQVEEPSGEARVHTPLASPQPSPMVSPDTSLHLPAHLPPPPRADNERLAEYYGRRELDEAAARNVRRFVRRREGGPRPGSAGKRHCTF